MFLARIANGTRVHILGSLKFSTHIGLTRMATLVSNVIANW